MRIWGFWNSCPKGLMVQQGRMGISHVVQAGLAATVLQVLGSALGDAGPCLPCSTASCQVSSPCQACRGVMPWFSLKLFILSPLLCLFQPCGNDPAWAVGGRRPPCAPNPKWLLWEMGSAVLGGTLWSQLQGACETPHWSLGPLRFLPRHYYEGERRLFIKHPPDQKPTPAGW